MIRRMRLGKLLDHLLRSIIMQQSGVIRPTRGHDRYVVASPVNHGALVLNDNRYLRLTISLYFEQVSEGRRLKTSSSSFQYQEDTAGDRWIVRDDYLRQPKNPHPGDHLQIRGQLTEYCLPAHRTLERVHFPTMRVSLEAVIRLLVDQLVVKCNERVKVWRRILATSEAGFLNIDHRSLSGPASDQQKLPRAASGLEQANPLSNYLPRVLAE
jgi:hypothetical protein